MPLVFRVAVLLCLAALAACSPVARPQFDFPIVDVHVHLSNLSLIKYSWDIPKLNYNWGCGNYTQAVQDSFLPCSHIVFCEVAAMPESWLPEVEWIQTLARDPACGLNFVGIVGHVALEADNVSQAIDEMQRRSPLLTGVREGESCTMLRDPALRRGVGELFRRGLLLETVCSWNQLDDVAELARLYPEGTIVVDHLGNPDIGNESAYEPWLQSIQALGRLPNVHVTISGAMEAAAHGVYGNWTVDEIRPYVLETIAAFGYERSMFAGNWFFVNLAGTYVQWGSALQTILRDTSPDEWRSLLHDTAMRVYGRHPHRV